VDYVQRKKSVICLAPNVTENSAKVVLNLKKDVNFVLLTKHIIANIVFPIFATKQD